MSSRVFAFLASAGLIAATVVLFIIPKLDENATESPQKPVETVNSVQAEEEDGYRRSAVLSIRNDGHYWARTVVNRKASVDFMVDTGASTVAITQDDARKMGLRPDDLTYDARIRTAGGETYGADVVIDSIKIGTVEVKEVHGVVMKEELTQSLLGMSFLRELYSYEFRGDRMIIRQ
ncbi:TIGR02281 family clan AA aspartic protease [Henriciella sp. AS95]|uniref:retropepsin-like aspartic protease family protein n=1 Tax=Henriciella sp. AS95 TaxID=3135782 RepID=UPI00316C887B